MKIIIIVLVVAYIIYRLIKWNFHRTLNKWVTIAQLSVSANFYDNLKQVTSDDEAILYATAASNYLFGKNINKLHLNLPLDEIHADAIKWMERDQLLKQLVVQSLRISSTVEYSKNGIINDQAIEILKVHGKSVPKETDPAHYEELVHRYFKTLTEQTQQQYRLRFGI